MPGEGLNVIALISGGKDSFFSLLHCIEHGHRVVALANLFPASGSQSAREDGNVHIIGPVASSEPNFQSFDSGSEDQPDRDLNSFMYQTVGHEIIPFYAAATGLPLYRQPIHGEAERHERDYAFDATESEKVRDETESMTSLLRAIMESHPEANAVSAGAILSTYQRTRVESVALRLGLTPLAYLWKYPILPPPSLPADDAQLLKDMGAAGLEARIIKVASAGLNEDHMWETVTTSTGAERVKAALRRFGASGGAVLGEGGEFETVVLDGPASLFSKRITVPSEGRRVVHEGGGSSWLAIRSAQLEDKIEEAKECNVRTPTLWDTKFKNIIDTLSTIPTPSFDVVEPVYFSSSNLLKSASFEEALSNSLVYWNVIASEDADCSSVETETAHVVQRIRYLLSAQSLEPNHISNTVIILRSMADFPKINAVYGKLFTKPNPPARVTVSCGDLLPHGRRIGVCLTADTRPQPDQNRQGLHVQSRSYWAPANIGPYSQAIGIPADKGSGGQGPTSWSIAGQIPLIPSLMVLPSASPTSQQTQIVLSLQHLWRIGIELNIQFWISAVAFFSRTNSDDNMRQRASMAGTAWRLAHGSPDENDDEGNGPDPWDLKYNPKFMSLGGDDANDSNKGLPDWSVLTLRLQNEPTRVVPPMFAVEVEELPRQSDVEWHAHTGLSGVDDSSVEVLQNRQLGAAGWTASHTVVRTSTGGILYTSLCRSAGEDDDIKLSSDHFEAEQAAAYRTALEDLKIGEIPSTESKPYLTYYDGLRLNFSWAGYPSQALVPCRSLWSSNQDRLDLLSLYRVQLKTIDLSLSTT